MNLPNDISPGLNVQPTQVPQMITNPPMQAVYIVQPTQVPQFVLPQSGVIVPPNLVSNQVPYSETETFIPLTLPEDPNNNRKYLYDVMMNRLYSREYTVDSCLWLNQAFDLFKTHWTYYMCWSVIYMAISIISSWLPPLIFLLYPLFAGLWFATFNIIRTTGSNKLEARDFLQGYKKFFPIITITLIQSFIFVVGIICFVLPGIYFGTTLCFAVHLYIEYYKSDISITDSLKLSHAVVKKQFFQILGYSAIMVLVALSGILCFGIGFLVTLPIATISTCYAVRDIFGLRDHHLYCIEHNIP